MKHPTALGGALCGLVWAALATPLAAQAVVNLDTAESHASIQDAIDDPDTLDGHVLEMLVADHTTPEVQTVFTKSVTVRGTGDVLRPSSDTGTSGDARGWFLVPLGVDVTLRGLVLDGTGHRVWNGVRSHGTLTVEDCTFREIKYDESGPSYSGIALTTFQADGLLRVSRCGFSEIGRIGIHTFDDAVIERCTYTGKGVGDWLDYFICLDSLGSSIGVATIADCTVTGNRGVASSDGSGSAGMLVTTFFGPGTEADITGCTLTDNSVGLAVGFDAADTSEVVVRGSTIAGNDFGVVSTSALVIVDATENWWGDVSGPADPVGTNEADDPPCAAASFTPGVDVVNADGVGDSVTDANVDYCPWLDLAPPCLTVADAEDCGVLTSTFEGPDLADLNNVLVVHYNAGVTPSTATPADVAFLEVRSAQFATNELATVPDPENYALRAVIPASTADGSNLPPVYTTLDSMSGGLGEPAFGGAPAAWTIDFHDGPNAPGDLAGSPFHTVLFGGVADGVCDAVQTWSSPTELLARTTFHVSDGIYHSVVGPEVHLPTATTWDGAGFATPVPGLPQTEPVLYGEHRAVELGDSTDPTLLTGSADPGFVTVWVVEPCTEDTLAAVATNRLALEILGDAVCYTAGDQLVVELRMGCLDQQVTGFFASVTFDPALLALDASSAYTSAPFPLHILDPIVDSGAPPGTLLLDGSVDFLDPPAEDDALLATLVFDVLAAGDGVESSVAFTVGSTFPSELSFEGLPVPTRLADPTGFGIDQTPPSLVCAPDVDVSTDPGECSALVAVAPPAAFDACGLLSVEGVRDDALPLDDPYPAGCAPGEETVITWTATDCAGLVSTCMQSVRVTDTEAPVISGTPGDVSVIADAGGCTAVVTWTDPTATDNCDASPAVSCSPPSGSVFPTGVTTVVCVATDACGNLSFDTFDVEVQGFNEVSVVVDLEGVFTPVSRCIRFTGGACGDTIDEVLAFVDHDSDPATPVRASASIEIPCGVNATLCAKDRQHTIVAITTLTPVGTGFVADSVLSLRGGDTDDDADVDINDVTLLIFQYGNLAADGGCPWDGTTRDADFSNNGAVGSEDYSFLVANFGFHPPCPCTTTSTGGGGARQLVVETASLPAPMRSVDRNADGLVDHRDVQLFELERGLPGTLSRMLARAGR